MIRALAAKAVRVFWLMPGFLLWAAFPPMGELSDSLFALAPLIWLSRTGDARLSARRWFVNGLLFWVATLSWMPAIVKNGGPWPLVVLGWGALAVYCAAYFAAFGYLSAKAWRFVRGRGYGWRLFAILFIEPVLWAGLELVRSRAGGGFAWNQLGTIPVNAGFGAPAAIGGVYLLSMVVLAVNGTVASIAERVLEPFMERRRMRMDLPGGTVTVPPDGGLRVRRGPPRWARSVETLLPFGLVFCLYEASSRLQPRAGAGDAVSVAMVQRNFPCAFDSRAEDYVAEYGRLFSFVEPTAPRIVVLPESAFGEIGEFGSASALRFAHWVCEKTGAKAVLGGGMRMDGGRMYNSAALYTAGEMVPQTYDKVHLVPFGEYIPGDKLVPALQKLAPVGSCTPGELKLLDFDGVKLGVAICYEDTDSAQMRRLAAMGAQVLVFITNDSWFSRSHETVQHAWQSVARAVETGLPVVRVGNSGVTGTVTPDGCVTWLVDAGGKPLVDVKGTMSDRIVPVSAGDGATPYVAVGDIPLAAAFFAVLAAFVCAEFRARVRACRPDMV